jgi:tetratricopeptide (TPR) repeat protein
VGSLRRWPIQLKPGGQEGDLLVGPPEAVKAFGNGRPGSLSFSRDGVRLAVSDGSRSEVLVLDVETGKVLLRCHHGGASQAALSPDGRWLASNTWGIARGAVRVWDVDAGRQAAEFEGPGAPLAFSPDNKFLVVGYGNEVQYRQVGSWESTDALRLEREAAALHCLAFSQEGSVLAVRTWRGAVRLLDWATGQELARLAAPNTEMASHLAFSRDDRWLAVVCQTQVVQLWDLRRIRRQLSDIGLDWQLPGPPPAIQEEKHTSSPRIEIDYGELPKQGNTSKETPQEAVKRWTQCLQSNSEDVDAFHHRAHAFEKLGERHKAIADFTAAIQRQPGNAHFHECRGRNYLALKEHAQAIADFEKALELKPDQADLCNNLAWLLVTGPKDLRDGKKAVPYAERAVKLAPTNGHYHNTLGLALYRAERYRDAITPLEASLKGNSGSTDGFDLFFLAMCYAKLGESEKAKECFDRAVKWVEGQRSLQPRWAEELKMFRAEAEEVLGKK